jgi:cytochrome c-type biogenesis protein CcmH/NrfG
MPCTVLELALRREQLRSMVRHLAQSLRANPDDASAWHDLGNTLVQLGERAGALTALRNSLLLDERRTDTRMALGRLLFDCGQLDSALACFDAAATT